jgi:bile acid:Na+ symporter, BASS family
MTITALLSAGLAFLMLVVGLRLSGGDFRNLWRQPRAVAGGFVAQMVILPFLALLISRMLSLSPVMSLGLLVVAAAPGGITSNFITLIARGDAALSATMTLGTSLAACVSIPLVLMLGHAPLASDFGSLVPQIARTGIAVLAVSAVPLLCGMALRRYFPALVSHWVPLLDLAATLIFLVIVAAAFLQNGRAMIAHAPEAGPAAVLLNAGAIAAAFTTGWLLRLPRRQTLAIAIECGLQNIAMAMFVAATILHDTSLFAPALVYAVVMNITAMALIVAGRFWSPRRPIESASVT